MISSTKFFIMTHSSNFYRKWINDSVCKPQVSACLIYDLDPEQLIKKNVSDYRNVTFICNVTEINDLVKIFTRNQPWWLCKATIFKHVEQSLLNNIAVSPTLLNEINDYRLNLIAEHIEKFNIRHPYIAKRLSCTQAHGVILDNNELTLESDKAKKDSVLGSPHLTEPSRSESVLSGPLLGVTLDSGEVINKIDTQVTFESGFPRFPQRQGNIAEVMKQSVIDFIKKHNVYPDKFQAWNFLRCSPPKNFSVSFNDHRSVIIDGRSLAHKEFNRRFKRYQENRIC